MYKIISWYNQNRRKFWLAVLTVGVIGLIVWYLLNEITQSNNLQINTDPVSRIDTNNLNSISIKSEKSAISGEMADISQDKISVIDNFISYCNSGKIKEAYNLISDECKEEMYPNVSDFQTSYYTPVFGSGKRNVSIENWTRDIYKVDLNEDFLSTGKYTTENAFQDYMTLVEDKYGNIKLNINEYIGRKEIGKTQQSQNNEIEVKIISRDTYMDYEYYTFEVTNNLEDKISLGDIQDLEASYLKDDNDTQYNACMYELSQQQLVLEGGQTKIIKIKYFNDFSSRRKIKALIFRKVILDYYREYSMNNTKIEIEL